jgi:hypothetical protein
MICGGLRHIVRKFIEAFLNQGTLLLDYITTDIDPPVEGATYSSASILENLAPVPNILNASFFALVSQCYAKHLYALRTSYGVDEPMQEKGSVTYTEGFEEYVEDVIADLPNWISTRLLSVKHNTQQLEVTKKVLKGLAGRIRFALTSSVFNSVQNGLELPTSTPILCRSFLIDVGSYLLSHSSPLLEVFRMIDPLFPAVLLESRTSNPFKDSPSAMLEQFIQDHEPNVNSKNVLNEVRMA